MYGLPRCFILSFGRVGESGARSLREKGSGRPPTPYINTSQYGILLAGSLSMVPPDASVFY